MCIRDRIGLGVAVDYLSNIGMDVVRQHERDLTAYALARLEEFEGRGLDVYGPVSYTHLDVYKRQLRPPL